MNEPFTTLYKASKAQLPEAEFVALVKFVAEDCARTCETLKFLEVGPTEAALRQRKLCAKALRDRFK
jgi:hypothetical protein